MSEELHSINNLYKEINKITEGDLTSWILLEQHGIDVCEAKLINDMAYQKILQEIWIATRP